MQFRSKLTLAAALLAVAGSLSAARGTPAAGVPAAGDAAVARPGGTDQATAELLAAEALLAAAIVKNDAAAVGNLLDDDWMIIDSDGGSVDKTHFLAVMKSGDLTHMKMDTSESRVRIYGNAAIVTARVATAGKFKGDPFTTDERASDFLVKKHGHWKFVFSQLTRAAGAP